MAFRGTREGGGESAPHQQVAGRVQRQTHTRGSHARFATAPWVQGCAGNRGCDQQQQRGGSEDTRTSQHAGACGRDGHTRLRSAFKRIDGLIKHSFLLIAGFGFRRSAVSLFKRARPLSVFVFPPHHSHKHYVGCILRGALGIPGHSRPFRIRLVFDKSHTTSKSLGRWNGGNARGLEWPLKIL